jgi:predicted Zn-dependent peptidase
LAVTKELDSIGAEYNAYTGQEYTGYYAKSHPKHFDRILDLISDVYLNPIFDEKEIEKEKGVIIEEINMYEDTPQYLVQDLFTDLLYGDQPAGWRVAGTKESVRSLTRDDIVSYRKKHYVASATTVVVAGNIDTRSCLRKTASSFGSIPVSRKHGKKKTLDVQTRPALLVKNKDLEQTHMVLGVRSFPVGSAKNDALRVLNAVLGGGMSSRLWQKVRQDMGVAYYVYSYPAMNTDHGAFSISAGVANDSVLDVADALIAELRRLRDELIRPEEIKKAKDYILGRLSLRLETSDDLGEFYAEQEVLERRIESLGDIAKKIKAVTAEGVRAIAREIFTNDRLNLALIGKFGDEAVLRKKLQF